MLLLNDLCRQAVNTRRMVLSSSGIQRRDFIALADVCRAIAHVLHVEGEVLGDGLYNVGTGWAPTVIEMTERIARCCHRTLGYLPEITRGQLVTNETTADLDYRIDKFLSTGFRPVGDVDAEVIGTLKFCAAASVRGQE